MAVTAWIGLGANLGNREATLRESVSALGRRDGIKVQATSRAYETAPVGGIEQPDFLNAVVRAGTTLGARELLDALLAVEADFGRIRKGKWGPRVLDLDVLIFGGEVIQEPGLIVPHPHMHVRAFVLAPFQDLDPDLAHPVLGLSMAELLENLDPGPIPLPVEGLSLNDRP